LLREGAEPSSRLVAVPPTATVWVSVACVEAWSRDRYVAIYSVTSHDDDAVALGDHPVLEWMDLGHMVHVEGRSKTNLGMTLGASPGNLQTMFSSKPQPRFQAGWLVNRARAAARSAKTAQRRGPTLPLTAADLDALRDAQAYGLGGPADTLWAVFRKSDMAALSPAVAAPPDLFAAASAVREDADYAGAPDLAISVSDDATSLVCNPVRHLDAALVKDTRLRGFWGHAIDGDAADDRTGWMSGAGDMIKAVRSEGLVGFAADSAGPKNRRGKRYYAGTFLDMLVAHVRTDEQFVRTHRMRRTSYDAALRMDIDEYLGHMLYEYIPPDVPVKLYLDLDAKIVPGGPFDTAEGRQAVVEGLVAWVSDRLAHYYGARRDAQGRPFVAPPREAFVILDSCDLRRERDGSYVEGKMSFHVILDGPFMFENNIAQAMFIAWLRTELAEAAEPPATLFREVMDVTIYKLSMGWTKDGYEFGTAQLFRMFGCHKAPDEPSGFQRPLRRAAFSPHPAANRDDLFMASIIQRPLRGAYANVTYFAGPCLSRDGKLPPDCSMVKMADGRLFYHIHEKSGRGKRKRVRTLGPRDVAPSPWLTQVAPSVHTAVHKLLRDVPGMAPWKALVDMHGWKVKTVRSGDGGMPRVMLDPPRRPPMFCMVLKTLIDVGAVPKGPNAGGMHSHANIVFYLVPPGYGRGWRLTQACMGRCRANAQTAAARGMDVCGTHVVAELTAEQVQPVLDILA
jgi:hypothetical protein